MQFEENEPVASHCKKVPEEERAEDVKKFDYRNQENSACVCTVTVESWSVTLNEDLNKPEEYHDGEQDPEESNSHCSKAGSL